MHSLSHNVLPLSVQLRTITKPDDQVSFILSTAVIAQIRQVFFLNYVIVFCTLELEGLSYSVILWPSRCMPRADAEQLASYCCSSASAGPVLLPSVSCSISAQFCLLAHLCIPISSNVARYSAFHLTRLHFCR